MAMKRKIFSLACVAILQWIGWRFAAAQDFYMSYPGLTGESAPLWIATEAGILKEYGIDAKLVYMEGQSTI
jgi:ABC-type nitrate/sulfonate/bicarbonate transport system substrate-binding protein